MDAKCKLRNLNMSYTLNGKYDEAATLFTIIEMATPDKNTNFSETNNKIDTMQMYHFKSYIYKVNLQIM